MTAENDFEAGFVLPEKFESADQITAYFIGASLQIRGNCKICCLFFLNPFKLRRYFLFVILQLDLTSPLGLRRIRELSRNTDGSNRTLVLKVSGWSPL